MSLLSVRLTGDAPAPDGKGQTAKEKEGCQCDRQQIDLSIKLSGERGQAAEEQPAGPDKRASFESNQQAPDQDRKQG